MNGPVTAIYIVLTLSESVFLELEWRHVIVIVVLEDEDKWRSAIKQQLENELDRRVREALDTPPPNTRWDTPTPAPHTQSQGVAYVRASTVAISYTAAGWESTTTSIITKSQSKYLQVQDMYNVSKLNLSI